MKGAAGGNVSVAGIASPTKSIWRENLAFDPGTRVSPSRNSSSLTMRSRDLPEIKTNKLNCDQCWYLRSRTSFVPRAYRIIRFKRSLLNIF